MLSRSATVFLILITASILPACDRLDSRGDLANASATADAEPADTADATPDGRALFAVCSTCHGPDGVGTQLGPRLTGPEWIHIDGRIEEIERIIRDGVGRPSAYPVPMPPMGGGDFDDDEVATLAAYVAGLGGG